MTTRRLRDLRRELATVAEPFGAKLVGIEHTGGSHTGLRPLTSSQG
jgi:hypothetical protein